jgi:hypothetical protein
MRYHVLAEDVEMTIKDWDDDWRIPVLNQEIPVEKEAKEEQEKTPAEDKMVPKKLRTGHNKVQQKKGGVPNKDTQAGKKNNTQAPQKK